MEPKASAAPQGDGSPAEAPRRRGGAGKRKSAGSSSSFTPSKRQAKERNAFHIPPHLLHSGPLTRAAYQWPHKLAATLSKVAPVTAGAGGSGTSGGKVEGEVIRLDGEETPAEETPLVDKVFAVVRSWHPCGPYLRQ